MTVLVLGDQQALPAAALVAARAAGPVVVIAGAADPIAIQDPAGRIATPPSGWQERITAALVVTRSAVLLDVIEPWAAGLSSAPILLAPGGAGGALRLSAAFQRWLGRVPPVGETTGFPAAAGGPDEARIRVGAVKAELPVAGVGRDDVAQLIAAFPGLPLRPAGLITTSLSNTNHVVHPPLMALNAARIEAGEEFRFYREGLGPGATELLEGVDADRVAVLAAYGGEPVPARDWMLRFYGGQGMRGQTLVECLASFDPFGRVLGPPSLDHRYLTDDVPYGLAVIAGLARHAGIATPTLAALTERLVNLAPQLALTADEEAVDLLVERAARESGHE